MLLENITALTAVYHTHETGVLVVVLLTIQFFFDVTLCQCRVVHSVSKDCSSFIIRVRKSKDTLMMKAQWSFEMLRTMHPVTQCHIQKVLNLQYCKWLFENLLIKRCYFTFGTSFVHVPILILY